MKNDKIDILKSKNNNNEKEELTVEKEIIEEEKYIDTNPYEGPGYYLKPERGILKLNLNGKYYTEIEYEKPYGKEKYYLKDNPNEEIIIKDNIPVVYNKEEKKYRMIFSVFGDQEEKILRKIVKKYGLEDPWELERKKKIEQAKKQEEHKPNFIIPDTVNPDLFLEIIKYIVNNNKEEFDREELKNFAYNYLENIEFYNIGLQETELEKEKALKRKQKAFSRVLTYLKNLGILENNKRKIKKITPYFIEKINKFKGNVDFIISEILKEKYLPVFQEGYISKKKIFELLENLNNELPEAKRKKKNTILKYTNMLFYLLNTVLKEDMELSELNDIISSGNLKENKDKIIKLIIEKLVMNIHEELDDVTIESIKKILKDTNLIENYVKYEFNNNLSNFLAVLTNRIELATFPDFYKNIPNANKSKEILERVFSGEKIEINGKKQKIDFVYFSSDTDNDGTAGKTIVEVLKNTEPRVKIANEYNKPSGEVKHGISYKEIYNYFVNNNLDFNTPFLLVTIDNGANNLEEIKKIKKDFPNVKVIVTDHHNPEYNLNEIKNEDIIVVNHHFQKNREVFEGFEPSGAETFAVIAKEIIKDNTLLPKSEKEYFLTWIENISQFSTIADMVKSFNHLFMQPELREKYGKIINKLNAILTLESLVKSTYNNNLELLSNQIYGKKPEELNEIEKEAIKLYFENLKNIEDIATKLNSLLYMEDFNEIKNIEEVSLRVLSNKEDNKQVKYYSNLFELRFKYLKLLTKPSLTPNEEFVLDLIDNKFKLLDKVKELERSFLYQLDTKNNLVLEKEYSTIVYTPGKNRKLTNKLDPKYYNGVLIMLDNLKEDEINGSIRIKGGILFEKLLRKNLDEQELTQNKKIINYLEKIGSDIGLDVKIKGHKTGAAGFIIKNLNKGLKNLGWDGKDETKAEYIKILLDYLNNEINNSYKNLLSSRNENILNINLKNLNGMDVLNDMLNVLKMSNITHGDKLKVNINVPVEEIKIINKENTAHIHAYSNNPEKQKEIIEYIKSYEKNYLGVVLNFTGQNLIINKQVLLKALEEKMKNPKRNIVLTFNFISPTSGITMEYNKISRKAKYYEIKNLKSKIVEQYSNYFNKNNNYTVKFNSIEEFVNNSPVIFNDKERTLIVENMKKIIEENNADEYVVFDVEGIGFGKNNTLFNIQVHRFTKNDEVITHSFFVDPEELQDNIALPPSIIKLTGINEEIIKKFSLPIDFVSNYLYKVFKNKKIIALAHNNMYDKNAMLTTLKGKIVNEIKKWTWVDTAQIARENGLAIREENVNSKFSIRVLNNENYKLDLGTYVKEENYPLSLREFIRTPFNNKKLRSEDNKHELIIKEEEGKYKLYLKDLENSAQLVYIEDLENIYEKEIVPANNEIGIRIRYVDYEGQEVKPKIFDFANFLRNVKKANIMIMEVEKEVKPRKFSVQEISHKILVENYKKFLEEKNNKIDINNLKLKTGILDIDNFYNQINKHIDLIIDFDIKNKEEFIKNNKNYIKENFEINFDGLENYIKKKFNVEINLNAEKTNIITENLKLKIELNKEELKKLFVEELAKNSKLNKTELKNYEKGEYQKVINSVFKKKKTNELFSKFIKNYILELPEIHKFKKEIFNKFKNDNISMENKIVENLYEKFSKIITNELIVSKLEGTELNIKDKLVDIAIEEYLKELFELVNINNYIDYRILKKVIELYNSNIDIRENKENFYSKIANFIPDTVLEYLFQNIEIMFQELQKNNPILKKYVQENNIKDIKELFVELHNNVHPINSDTGIESMLVLLSMINNKKIALKIPEEFQNAILKEYYKTLKNENKKSIPNSFSFNQLINILNNDEFIDNEYLQSQIKYLKNEFKKGFFPIKINSSNTLLIAKVKLKKELRDLINLNNIEEYSKYKTLVAEMESYLNYMYDIKRMINTVKINSNYFTEVYFTELKNKLNILEEEFRKKFGEFYLIENPLDNFLNSLKETKNYNTKVYDIDVEEIKEKIIELKNLAKNKGYLVLKDEARKILKKLPSLSRIINQNNVSQEEKKEVIKSWLNIINTVNEILIENQEKNKRTFEIVESKANKPSITKLFTRTLIENIDLNINKLQNFEIYSKLFGNEIDYKIEKNFKIK